MPGEPYIITEKVVIVRSYYPDYGDDRVCQCGHPYYRHFDDMDPSVANTATATNSRSVMSKKIDMVVHSCQDCPFREYDGDYGLSYDSGHDCTHEDATRTRIVNDGGYDNHKNVQAALSTIPEWCPLEDA